jgi:acetyltransferase-like isoleucine patch superfamily enzyme
MLTEKPRLPIGEILIHGLLPSPLKKWVYRLKGYRIGKNVSIGFGSVVCGRDVEIGDHTCIGFMAAVRGRRIRIGAHVQIGATTIIDTPRLEIGEGTKINEQVFVGGLQFPDSELVIGRNCQIMQMTFINPTTSIRIGDDTGIGGHCLLFGHTSWLSKFEGYPVDFQSIEIGSSVSVAWRVFILPGSRIGDGAVIGANSLVNRTVPPRCLAVGFPARVVSKAPDFPLELTDADRERLLREIVSEMIAFLRGFDFECRENPNDSSYEVVQATRRWGRRRLKTWRLKVVYAPLPAEAAGSIASDLDVLLSLRRIPQEIRTACDRQRTLWVDIAAKERSGLSNDMGEEVVQYLRRYGVRFLRVYPERR